MVGDDDEGGGESNDTWYIKAKGPRVFTCWHTAGGRVKLEAQGRVGVRAMRLRPALEGVQIMVRFSVGEGKAGSCREKLLTIAGRETMV